MIMFPRDKERKPGTWKALTIRNEHGVSHCAALFCPKCGELIAIGFKGGYTVALDGTVSPSVICTRHGCAFHAFVCLAGWEHK